MAVEPGDEVGHVHQDVSGGWLRPAVFGAMDGLVTNIALVAGVGGAGAGAGVNPDEQPSPWVAGGSSFLCCAIGALVPLIPYLLGFDSLAAGLAAGAAGLFLAGASRPRSPPARGGGAGYARWDSARSPQ